MSENILNIIQNKSIEIIEKPSRHIVVDNFFKDDFYKDVCVRFHKVFSRGLSENFTMSHFFRFPNNYYDAYCWTFDPKAGYPLNFFYSAEWDDFISGIFGITTSKDSSASFHHHKIGSKDGFVHNDFNLCSFKENRLKNGVNPSYYQCKYTDDTPDLQPDTFKRMRSVAMIYFLANEPWQEGDGGESGLYATNEKSSLAKKIAPLNNRLFAMEISPVSFHGFLQNKKSPRNSMIQWLHQEPMSMFQKYGVYEPTRWEY